jgi:hypothetical protein
MSPRVGTSAGPRGEVPAGLAASRPPPAEGIEYHAADTLGSVRVVFTPTGQPPSPPRTPVPQLRLRRAKGTRPLRLPAVRGDAEPERHAAAPAVHGPAAFAAPNAGLRIAAPARQGSATARRGWTTSTRATCRRERECAASTTSAGKSSLRTGRMNAPDPHFGDGVPSPQKWNRLATERTALPDPVLGDAMTNPQQWNRYSYVGANPLKYIDPNGRDRIVVNYSLGGQVSGRSMGHAGIAAVFPDGSVKFADFGPVPPGGPSGRLEYGSSTLPTRSFLARIRCRLRSPWPPWPRNSRK